MRPPGKSPQQKWFDKLPGYDPASPGEIFTVFTGVVNDVENIIVYIDNANHVRVVMEDYNIIWRFDYAGSRLYAESATGSNWAQQIVDAVGMGLVAGSSYRASSLSYNMITCKLNPSLP